MVEMDGAHCLRRVVKKGPNEMHATTSGDHEQPKVRQEHRSGAGRTLHSHPRALRADLAPKRPHGRTAR